VIGRVGGCPMALVRPDGVLAARTPTDVADYLRRLAAAPVGHRRAPEDTQWTAVGGQILLDGVS
jgi:hypothetical protein